MKRCLFLSAVVLLAALPVLAQQRPVLPDSVDLIRDVEFGTGGGRPLKMHVLRPKKQLDAPLPVIVWIHGGGWSKGHRDSDGNGGSNPSRDCVHAQASLVARQPMAGTGVGRAPRRRIETAHRGAATFPPLAGPEPAITQNTTLHPGRLSSLVE